MALDIDKLAKAVWGGEVVPPAPAENEEKLKEYVKQLSDKLTENLKEYGLSSLAELRPEDIVVLINRAANGKDSGGAFKDGVQIAVVAGKTLRKRAILITELASEVLGVDKDEQIDDVFRLAALSEDKELIHIPKVVDDSKALQRSGGYLPQLKNAVTKSTITEDKELIHIPKVVDDSKALQRSGGYLPQLKNAVTKSTITEDNVDEFVDRLVEYRRDQQAKTYYYVFQRLSRARTLARDDFFNMMVTVCKEYKEYNEKDGTNEKITRLLLQSFANQYGGMFYDNASKSTKDDILADATYAVFKSKSKAIELVQGVHESYDIDRINKRLDDIEKKERLDKGGKAQQGGLGIEGGNVANSLDAQGSDLAPPAHTVGRRSDERAEGHPGANSSGRQQSPKRSGSSNSNSPSPNPSQGNRTVTPGGFTITNMAKLSNGDGDRR